MMARARELDEEGGKAGKYEQLLRSAIEQYADAPDPRLRLAAALAAEDPGESMKLCRRAVDLGGDDPGVLTRAASLAFDLGEIEDARTWTKCAIRQAVRQAEPFPLSSSLVHLAGKLAWDKGNVDLAERYLRGAFEVDPALPRHAEALADLMSALGRPEEALTVLDEAVRIRGDGPQLRAARQRVTAGND